LSTACFEFATAQRVVFGRGQLASLPELAAGYGARTSLVAGDHLKASGALAALEKLLVEKGLAVDRLLAHGEPEVPDVDAAAERMRASCAEVVVGIGGGSVLDLAKAAAGVAANGGSVREYLEGVGNGRLVRRPGLPFIAVPTTAGTGSEVTRNAVIASRAEGFKKSIRSPLLLPAVALVDPALTDSVPPEQTAASGLDALTQLIEPYVSLRAQPMTDALALEGIRLAARALPRAFIDPGDRQARDDLALASLLGGLCLANAGLGAVHGIAAALGALCELGHGLSCATVLAATLEGNIRALERRDPRGPALARYARLGEVLAGRSFSSASEARKAAVATVRSLVETLEVPRLGALGVGEARIAALVEQSRGSSMRSNPIALEDGEIEAILRAAL
jgi:alcohol dehydrogenase class IV